MRNPLPVPVEELRALAKSQRDPIIRKLLWEVRRLRIIEARAAQIVKFYYDDYYRSHHSLGDSLMHELGELVNPGLMETYKGFDMPRKVREP